MVKLKNIDLPAALKERYGGVYDGTPYSRVSEMGLPSGNLANLSRKRAFRPMKGVFSSGISVSR